MFFLRYVWSEPLRRRARTTHDAGLASRADPRIHMRDGRILADPVAGY